MQFDWLHPKTVRISPYMYKRKISEALEINALKTINERTKSSVLNWETSFHENGKPLKCNL